MHDPDCVAVVVRLPIPRLAWQVRNEGRYGCRRRRYQQGAQAGDPIYPWWRPNGYDVVFRGYRVLWYDLITVWHHEPGGEDSGRVCKYPHGLELRHHLDHLWLQVHPTRQFQRWAFTRCAWCGGRSRKNDPVNCHMGGWDDNTRPSQWWHSEVNLYHSDCTTVYEAHQTCVCEHPVFEHELSGVGYGTCARCLKHRAWSRIELPEYVEACRILRQTCPKPRRMSPSLRRRLQPLWDASKERQAAARQDA